MYLEDTFLKDFIHKLNNHLMIMKLNLEDLYEYMDKSGINDEFLADSIKKQENYILKISNLLKELKKIKMNETLLLEPKEIKKLTGKALVVDDEQALLNIMKRYLEKMGLDVDVTASGEDGLDKIKNSRYHYLITDLKMPGLDGQTLIKLGKEGNLLEDTIVIVITGGLLNEYSEEQRNSLRKNIDGFLQKPFSKDELYRLLCSFEP